MAYPSDEDEFGAATLLEIARIENFIYEPEQIINARLMGQNEIKEELQETNEPKIVVYPNPTTGIFNLKILGLSNKSENYYVEIINVLGSILIRSNSKFESGLNESKINLSNFPPGLYYCRVYFGNKMLSEKISKYIK